MTLTEIDREKKYVHINTNALIETVHAIRKYDKQQ